MKHQNRHVSLLIPILNPNFTLNSLSSLNSLSWLRSLAHRSVVMAVGMLSATALMMSQATAEPLPSTQLPSAQPATNWVNASNGGTGGVNGITINTTAQLVSNNNGKEVFMPLNAQTQLVRGNVIEYHVYLTNTNNDRIRTMKANITIPNGVQLLGAVSPEATMGSVDGQNFYPMPLRTQVGGQIQPIPLGQYKALQWQIEDVGLNQTANVSYRVVVE